MQVTQQYNKATMSCLMQMTAAPPSGEIQKIAIANRKQKEIQQNFQSQSFRTSINQNEIIFGSQR